jgi:4'-phosphopantetheinyl transferase
MADPKPVRCDIWWSRPLDDPSIWPLLDPTERIRLASFRQDADRARFATGRAMVRFVVATKLGVSPLDLQIDTDCRFCGKPHGKPYVRDSGLSFSVSHAADRVVLAVTAGRNPGGHGSDVVDVGATEVGVTEVGVDVEQVVDVDLEALSRRTLAAAEQAVLRGLSAGERAAAYFTYWTRKEALTKATGRGLATPMNSIVVSAAHERAAVVSWPDSAVGDVQLHDLAPGAGYVGAVAVLTPSDVEIVEHDVVLPGR